MVVGIIQYGRGIERSEIPLKLASEGSVDAQWVVVGIIQNMAKKSSIYEVKNRIINKNIYKKYPKWVVVGITPENNLNQKI